MIKIVRNKDINCKELTGKKFVFAAKHDGQTEYACVNLYNLISHFKLLKLEKEMKKRGLR